VSDLPLFPLDVVVFPGMTVPLYIFEERYKTLVRRALADGESRFVIALARDATALGDGKPRLPDVGAFVSILTTDENADGSYQVLVHGQGRCRVQVQRTEHIEEPGGQKRPLHYTIDEPVPLERGDPNQEMLAAWDAIDTFRRYAETFFAFDALRQIDEALPDDPLYQASFICANVRIPLESRQVLLEAPTLTARFELARKLMEERLAGHRPDDASEDGSEDRSDDAFDDALGVEASFGPDADEPGES
jgi:ATP-dependent Lon protease